MPVINRFRIVNFRYDNDKKYIANELFDFGGENALINLENGGGEECDSAAGSSSHDSRSRAVRKKIC